MVDVRRDAIDFRGEGDGGAGDVNDFAVSKCEIAALRMFSALLCQSDYGVGEEEEGEKAPLPSSM